MVTRSPVAKAAAFLKNLPIDDIYFFSRRLSITNITEDRNITGNIILDMIAANEVTMPDTRGLSIPAEVIPPDAIRRGIITGRIISIV